MFSSSKIGVASFDDGKPPTPDALMVALLEQQQIIDKKSTVISNQKARIAVLEELLQQAKVQRFAASSEKNVLQSDFVFDEAEALADGSPGTDDGECDETAAEAEPKTDKPPRKRKPRGLSPDLPRTQVRIELTDEERAGAIDTFFVKVREQLDITPAKVQVIEFLQEKAVVLDAEGERTLIAAARPAHPIGKGIASINLLVWIIISKYADGLPLYRLEKILARYGGEITRTTMANWIIRLHASVVPLLDRLEAHLLSSDYMQGDETPIQVLKEPGMAPTGNKYMWVMRGGPPGRTVVMFNYDKSRGGAVAERLLTGFGGRYFQSDGYSGYDAPCKSKGLVHLGCWDHARRKFVDAVKAQPKPAKGQPSVAMVALSKVNVLYRIERELADLDDDERFEERQKQAVPKLIKLRAWLNDKQPKVASGMLTSKAINYAINQWDHLIRYCEHGQLRISNVLAENAIRPFALGRRAWLFADTPAGARASAAWFTLIETAKANGVEPSAYLQHVISNIAAADTDEALDALLPWNMS